VTNIVPWKKSRVVAGAMMLMKGYVEPVSICDHCQRTLVQDDGCIDVTFGGAAAHYTCPHCSRRTSRKVKGR
jgi:hypothetical protein